MSGLLPSIIFPGDIRAVQGRLSANAAGLDAAVQACANVDAPTKTAWGAFFAAVKQYVALKPAAIPWGSNEVATTGTLYDQGITYERELYAWQQLIAGKKCSVQLPAFNPSAPDAQPPIVTLVKWAAILGVAGTVAYVAAEFSPIIGLAVARSRSSDQKKG